MKGDVTGYVAPFLTGLASYMTGDHIVMFFGLIASIGGAVSAVMNVEQMFIKRKILKRDLNGTKNNSI